MKKTILFFIILFVNQFLFSFELIAPSEVEQGGVITIITDAEINTVVTLEGGEDILSKSKVFAAVVEGQKLKIVLLGVPSTLKPGKYFIKSERGNIKSINVESVEFIHEDIPLTKSMSNLRKSDDTKKFEQWRELLAIMKTVNTENIYEKEGLEVPVKDFLRTSSFYGDRRKFIYNDGTSAKSIHNGIDYSAVPGTPVYAGGDGRVVFAGERIISGNTVVIEHLPGVYSMYYHLMDIHVKKEDILSAGDPVGTVGATGLVTGAHLHWEVRVAGVAVNPEPLLAGSIIDKDFIMSKIKRGNLKTQ